MSDREDFIKAIRHVYEYSKKKWRQENEKSSSPLRHLYNKSICFFHLYNRYELDFVFKNSGDVLEIPNEDVKNGKKRMILPPILYKKNQDDKYYKYIPFISFRLYFKNDEPVKNSLYLDLYKDDDKIIGLRYDQKSSGSNHDFFHIQINNNIQGFSDNHPCNSMISWLPIERPFFPVVDNNNVTPIYILFFLFGSLYGFEQIHKIFIGCQLKQSIYAINSLKEYYKLID